MVWVPRARGTSPAPTAAAEPLDEPPGVWPGSRGLRVGPAARWYWDEALLDWGVEIEGALG